MEGADVMMDLIRGCGKRKPDGLYVCCGNPHGLAGLPIDAFLVDPPIPWDGQAFRSPIITEIAGKSCVLMWVGAQFYPYVPDFVEEARVWGISKRVPRNFEFEKLPPGRTYLALIHPRAIAEHNCALPPNPLCKKSQPHNCLYDTWTISIADSVAGKHDVVINGNEAVISIPCGVKYYVSVPDVDLSNISVTYKPGIFGVFPLTHLEYVHPQKIIASDIADRAISSGWLLRAMDA